MGKILWGFIALCCFSSPAIAQHYTVSGYVKDQETGEVLIGANIYNAAKENGAATNAYGFFSYTTAKDTVDLVVSYIGYAAQHLSFYLDKNLDLTIELVPGEELDEIVVTAEERIEESTQMSRVNVPVELIKSMPALMGEVDVLKALQMLPGIQSGTEGTSGLYVRGGGPDQNLILLDGVPVYNASHLFGFVSVFNADAINNIDLVKGGFPARYGGRLSSVIDINLKEGNKEEIKGEGSIGIISSKLTLDGPVSDKTTFLVSGRRTYIDLIARPIIKAQTDGEAVAGYYFYDLNTKINHRFSDKDRLFLSGYFGKDKAYAFDEYTDRYQDETYIYKEELGLQWGNITTALRWNHIYNPKLFGNVTLTYSRYLFDIYGNSEDTYRSGNEVETEEERIRYYSGINDVAAKADYDFLPSPEHHIRFGGSAIRHRFNPGVLAYKSSVESDTTLGSQRTNAAEFFLYAEDDFELTRKLKLNLGLHFSGFEVDNQLYHSIEPRVAANYLLPGRYALKGSYTRMTQYIHLLTNSGIGLPTDLWVPSTARVKPQTANQYALGIAKTFDDMELSIEGYYKKMENMIEYKEGATYLSIEDNWEDKVTVGTGEAYGVEFFLQKRYGKWNGWLGYTLSWNFRQFDDVNFGERYPYKYDRRNDISAVVSYTPRRGVEYSATWVYGTGNAMSLPVSTYPGMGDEFWGLDFGNTIEHYEGRNGFRMPSYHRLDISGSWTKPTRWGERTWSVGLYNTYNRKNPFFIDVEYDYRTQQEQFIQYSLFPLIPSVTYSFKF